MNYYFTNSAVDSDLLQAQIQANVTIEKVVTSIDWTAPSNLHIQFNLPLSNVEFDALNVIATNHKINITLAAIKKAISNAKAFGSGMIEEYSVTRVLRGTTDAETLEVLRALHLLQGALMTGSLKAARLILLEMAPTPLIPQADIDMFLHKINKYLGIV